MDGWVTNYHNDNYYKDDVGSGAIIANTLAARVNDKDFMKLSLAEKQARVEAAIQILRNGIPAPETIPDRKSEITPQQLDAKLSLYMEHNGYLIERIDKLESQVNKQISKDRVSPSQCLSQNGEGYACDLFFGHDESEPCYSIVGNCEWRCVKQQKSTPPIEKTTKTGHPICDEFACTETVDGPDPYGTYHCPQHGAVGCKTSIELTNDEEHIGLHSHRVATNPKEGLFQSAWKRYNEYFLTLEYLVGDGRRPATASERDKQIAATVVQWLGSPVGISFLEELGFTQTVLTKK